MFLGAPSSAQQAWPTPRVTCRHTLAPLLLQTASGIFLPEVGKKLNEGEVVAVGPGATTRDGKILPMNVKVRVDPSVARLAHPAARVGGAPASAEAEFWRSRSQLRLARIHPHTPPCPRRLLPQVGDKVLLPEYGGHQVKVGEDEFHLYREEDILGKFK